MYSKRTKIIAIMLVFMLTITHLNIIGEVLATSLESQTTSTNHSNVEFDVYFTNEGEKEHSTTSNIGEENYLYTLLNVKNTGYLKNAIITADNANFKILEILENNQIQKVENNKIYFNQIKNGNTVEIAFPIEILQNDTIAVEEFNKETKLKLTAIYVDGKGKEKQIEKETTVKLTWTKEKQIEINAQVSKFVPYNINENKMLLLQTTVKSYLKDNVLPVKENKIEIEVPTIGGVKPQEVKVFANTTKATNGEEKAENFSESNYKYDENTNKLTITVNNEANEQGKVSWKKDAQDEFVVNYIYSEEALNAISEEGIKLKINAKSELTIYEANQTKVNKTFEGEVTLKDQIGNLVDFEVSTNVESLSKGQIYANYQTKSKVETEYKQTITVNIAETKLTDKIILEQDIDNFVAEANIKSEAKETYYKTITINQKEANKILEEEGTIHFYLGTTEIAKIDNETKANEQGNFVVNLSEANINTLKIEIRKPQAEGKLNFEVVKALKGESAYSKIEMKNFETLELNLLGKALNGEGEITKQSLTKEITFTEPTSQAELVIDNANLSTVVTNENVKITAILKTDTLNCSLYQNPTLAITLPSYVENINIKNIEVLFDTEGSKLTLKAYDVISNADGTKTILVTLEGTQTEYTLGAISKGVNVVITTDITANKLTPNKQEQITMVYTNSNIIANPKARTLEQDVNQVTVPVTFVAPTGVVTTTAISNYKEGAETLTSISGEEKTATIETIAEARDVKFEMNVINNYNNTIDTISILGRTPFKGNKNIVTGNDLSSTMTMPLTSSITVSNVDASKVAIYYSENGEASKDLNATANGWTLAPSNLANVKSYLIVIANHSMNTGENISFTYNAQIPANLQHNESAYENYVVYFNNNLETGTIQDEQASTKIGVTTGKGPELEVKLTSNVKEEQRLITGKFIKYTITVKNTGEEVAKNVEAKMDIPNCTNYIEFFEGESGQYTSYKDKGQINYQLGEINPNQEISKSFWVEVIKIKAEDICSDETHYAEYNGKKIHKTTIKHEREEFKTEIAAFASVVATDLAKEIKSNEIKNNVEQAYFNISTGTTTNGIEKLRKGDTFEYIISVRKNDSNDTLKNTVLKTKIPEGLIYQETQIETFNSETSEYEKTSDRVEYNEQSKVLTINLGEIANNDDRTIKITSKVEELSQGEYSRKVISSVNVSADGVEEETSNEIIDTIVKSGIKVTQTSSIPEGNKISAGEKFSYKIIVENIGADEIGNIMVEDKLPTELQYISTEYTIGGETKTTSNIDENNITKLLINIPEGETVEININVSAKEVKEEKQISNSAKISSDNISAITTNEIKHTIEAFEYENIENITSITRKISGQVWRDENNNGIKDEEEAKMADVEVMLFNNETGSLVTDSEGNVIKVTTGEDGTYTFTNIPQGKYTVIFLYDTANYSATVYRKENVDETKNSDAVDSNITLNGITRMAGITEEVSITDSNIYSIDLGLINNPKFDLKLDKTISSITIQDSTGTKKYEYKDSKLAKKDLNSKRVNETSIVVEYKIKVTNEGAISGFVKKIADYMPSEMKFNSELNKDWYTSENGILYNSSLANTIINPGESKELTLTLTKKMTEDNLGIYHNEAEIYEAYNDLGITDVDSTPANRTSSEDDISTADVVITVKTGETILVIALSTTIILMISIGAYFIKKKVLR